MLKLLSSGKEKTIVGGLVVLAGASAAFISNGVLRAAAVVLCCVAALFFALHLYRKYRESLEKACTREHEREARALHEVIDPLIAHLNTNVQITPVLISQLRDVTRQTEQAALDMGEKFMAIVGRARKQAESAAEAVAGFSVAADEVRKLSDRSDDAADQIKKLIDKIEAEMGSASEKTEKSLESAPQSRGAGKSVENSLAALDGMMIGAKGRLDSLKTENEALARDISGIIMSMQFQDITSQRIDHVIEQLARFRQETGELLERLRGMNERISLNTGSRADRLEQTHTRESGRNKLLALIEK